MKLFVFTDSINDILCLVMAENEIEAHKLCREEILKNYSSTKISSWEEYVYVEEKEPGKVWSTYIGE